MPLTLEATYENGVFVPVTAPAIPDHERVSLVVEKIRQDTSRHRREAVKRSGGRIKVRPDMVGTARNIITAPGEEMYEG